MEDVSNKLPRGSLKSCGAAGIPREYCKDSDGTGAVQSSVQCLYMRSTTYLSCSRMDGRNRGLFPEKFSCSLNY